jgi:hypothetical protein
MVFGKSFIVYGLKPLENIDGFEIWNTWCPTAEAQLGSQVFYIRGRAWFESRIGLPFWAVYEMFTVPADMNDVLREWNGSHTTMYGLGMGFGRFTVWYDSKADALRRSGRPKRQWDPHT